MLFSQDHDDDDVRFSPLVEVTFSERKDSGFIEGYASTWGGPPDSYGTMFAQGSFARTLEDHKRESTAPIMLWAHRTAEPIGRWEDLREDQHGLFVRGRLNLQTDRGREAHAHLKAGDVSGLSVGVLLGKDSIKGNGDGTSTITRADLFEISVVAVPSNRRARIAQVRSLNSKNELIELLRSGGIPKAAASRIAAGGWPALAGADATRAQALIERLDAATAQIRSLK